MVFAGANFAAEVGLVGCCKAVYAAVGSAQCFTRTLIDAETPIINSCCLRLLNPEIRGMAVSPLNERVRYWTRGRCYPRGIEECTPYRRYPCTLLVLTVLALPFISAFQPRRWFAVLSIFISLYRSKLLVPPAGSAADKPLGIMMPRPQALALD